MITVKWVKGVALKSAKDALTIRHLVFVDEQGFYDDVEETDDAAWHLTLYDDGKPFGCSRIFSEEEGVFHAGRIALLKEYRGRHLGSLIMEEIGKKAKELGAKKLVLGAQYQVVPFYQKQGYTVCSEQYLDQGYPHFEMEKAI